MKKHCSSPSFLSSPSDDTRVTPLDLTPSRRANLREAANDSYSPRGHTPITSNARRSADQRSTPTRCDAGTGEGITGTAIAVRWSPMNGVKHSIKVLLVDDHHFVRKGLCSCLADRPNLSVVGEASNGKEAIRKVQALSPDVVLMDIQMPEMDGLAATKVLHQEFPQVKVLILSMYSNHDYVRRGTEAGAHGYVLKDAPPDEIVGAIEAINAGRTFFSPSVGRMAVNGVNEADSSGPFARVSDREREVLTLLANGNANKAAAQVLGISARTVEAHRESIVRKLNIRSVAGLTKIALVHGLVSLYENTP